MRLLVVVLTILAWPLGAAVVLSQEQTPEAAPAADQAVPAMDPSAIAALGRMTSYLRSLENFEVTGATTREFVLEDGTKVMFNGTTTIRVRRPDAFMIDVASDRKVREYYYDGSQFTIVAPRMGFYAAVDAPPTIRETLDMIDEQYGINMPLQDLMDWSAATADDAAPPFESAVNVGYAKINGVDCGQYLFHTAAADLQLWIPAGEDALPQKIVITNLDDEARPQFVANLTWNENAALADAAFTFMPPADAKPITIASYEP